MARGTFADAQQKAHEICGLETELKAKDPAIPVAVVCHIPILSVTVFDDSKIYSDGKHQVSSARMCRDSIDLVAFLSKYNVRLALSGHMHILDRIDYRGVTFINEGAVSGAWWKGAHKGFAEGFGIVDCTPVGCLQHRYHLYGWNAST